MLGGSLAFGALAFGASAGWSSSAQAEEPKKGGVLKIGIGGGSSTDPLDPALIASPMTRILTRSWGEGLVAVNPDGTLDYRLAESATPNDDGTEWAFKIRQGVKFHDGTELTPDDVVATYKRHSDEKSQSVALALMKGITDMRVDGQNVVLKLSTANSDLPYLLSDYHLPIQPRGGVDKPDAAIGTGPYKLVSYQPGVRIVMEKNMDDWDATRGHYDGLEIIVINDSTARVSALQSGQVHMINQIDPKIAKFLKSAPGIQVRNTPSRSHYAFEAHVDTAPFNSKDLRLALKYAMNREEMLDKILGGFGTIGNDVPINGTYPLFANELEQRPFDLAKAAEHYQASGHDGSPIELFVAETVFPGAVDAALLWQATAQQAGIPLAVRKVPDDGYWADIAGVKSFHADNYLGRPVQDQQYTVFFQTGAEWNLTHFNNSEFDALLIEARGELDEAKRKELYAKMASILWDEGGLFVPVFADFINAHSDKIAGWSDNPTDELMGGLAPSRTWFA
uniref:ABC transporter substrate-binding protein n=1 Tax=Mesorhizobium sp. LHD-90 TaxID=3071414 RepID=UPI0035A90F66